jgi:hypothetical protein
MKNENKKKLAHFYQELCVTVSRILYRHDPDGMGSTICAPQGEYDGEAANLVSKVRALKSENATRQVLTDMYKNVSEDLIREISQEWELFRAKRLQYGVGDEGMFDPRAVCANPQCQKRDFKEGDLVTSCPACGKHYHDECWPSLGQQHECSTPGSFPPSYGIHRGGVIVRKR